MTLQLSPQDALNKAKIALMSKGDSAFFTTLAFSLIHEFDNRIPTAATNGKRIKYNPDFFMSLDSEERVFLMLHEAMHCAYLHMERGHGYDQQRFNIAADHVINLQLKERGFKMPECGIADDDYKGLSTEEVYNLLPQNPGGSSGNGGVPGFGADLESPEGDDTPEAREQLKQDIQDILCRAAMQSKMSNDKPGTIPGEIELFLDKLLNPKLPWNRILQKYLNSFSKNDYSFRKPNRRFFPQHIMPSMYGENLIDLAAFADISGSVTDHEFHVQLSETAAVMRMMKPKQIMFGQFDTEIKQVDKITSLADMRHIHFTGRGGTMIEPVLEWANTHKPQLLLVFTDGHFDWPELTTKVPVIWLIYNNPNFTAPYGKVIHYEITERN
jgi:predicted metal-dependent peptidase